MSSIGVVLDACVLIPATVRDTLLRAAQEDFYRLQLTEDILEEVRRNLGKKFTTEEKALKLVNTIRRTFPESLVKKHSILIPSMPLNEKDRHVLAAAVASGAQIIVTENLKDFPQHHLQPLDIEAQSSDDFLTDLFYSNPEGMRQVLLDQAKQLCNPSKTVSETLDSLRLFAPTFVDLIEQILQDEDIDIITSVSAENAKS